ncbi:DUF4118 domain-containing protein [Sphaerisporangium sp. TRM90804]|uniref:GAF domain-containing sensor histidine kinase n=1 Tax=Sphaerisporangium sp. TRM90804 TaxID=3031113 RepID=UPI002447971D|nr:DUF4118 domain-containing protein [Sphaerisporangium sp. TRM90804]MDH2430235.1 DUF4118 domain-containing protein [Sphaerisporangium sp. TRM90804]
MFRCPHLLLSPARPPLVAAVLVAAGCLLAETAAVHLLKPYAPADSLGVVYLLGVLLVSVVWGLWAGVVTAVTSALFYGYFHLPSADDGLGDAQDGLTLLLFLVVALVVGSVAAVARSLAAEAQDGRRAADERRRAAERHRLDAEERRGEADLTSELSRVLLCTDHLPSALRTVGRRLGQRLGVEEPAIVIGEADPGPGRMALPIRDGCKPVGTLLLPADLPEAQLRRLTERIVPGLAAVLSAARDRAEVGRALQASRDDLHRVAEEQAALRRVATLVARGVSPQELFDAVVGEVGRVLRVQHTMIARCEHDGMLRALSSWSVYGPDFLGARDRRWRVDLPGVAGLVCRTGRAASMTDYATAEGEAAAWARRRGIRSAIGIPITVEGRLWGVMVALSQDPEPAPGMETRMREFTELLGTAVSNAQVRGQLAASRARAVAAADDTRRRIERDLHDGTQQRLVTLGIELRAVEAGVPPEQAELRSRLADATGQLSGVIADLQELSRGLHPAILSRGGLGPALKMLARRSPVPVELTLDADRRLAERVEVAVYFIVSEALTNMAKHSGASHAHVGLEVGPATLRLSIRDDGAGGADPAGGSGLAGLCDRVEVLGGTLDLESPPGGGTSLTVAIPLDEERPAGPGRASRSPEPGVTGAPEAGRAPPVREGRG